MPWAVGMVVAVALVSGSCDDDDEGGDIPYGQGSVTCVVDGLPVNLSFMTSGQYEPISGKTGVSGLDMSQIITITFPGTAPGTWASPAGGAEVMYVDAVGDTYLANDLEGLYTITVSAYGPVGGLIAGTFSATVNEMFGGGASHVITGSFTVVRIPEM
jgi:hypothetical protein